MEEESIIGGHLIAECVSCVSGWSFSEKSTVSGTANKRNKSALQSCLLQCLADLLQRISVYISIGGSNTGKYWCIRKCKFIANDKISRKADGRLTAVFGDETVSVALFRQLMLILVSGVKVVDYIDHIGVFTLFIFETNQKAEVILLCKSILCQFSVLAN